MSLDKLNEIADAVSTAITGGKKKQKKRDDEEDSDKPLTAAEKAQKSIRDATGG